MVTMYVLIGLVILAIVFAKMAIVIIPQSETRIIERLGKEQGKTMECSYFVQTEAWNALTAGHPEEHNRILLANIKQLDTEGYDAIVMSQVSMRALLPELGGTKTPVLCSFYSGYGAAADYLNKLRTEG